MQAGQFVDFAQHVGKVVEVVHRIDLALGVTLLGTGGARGLQITFRIALAIDEIELQLYRYYGE
ncbi:hypothetical protein D3C77_709110 [compost metagenome]